MDTGLLIIRVVIGLSLAAHGAQKLFGAFGGHGIAGTGGFFESLGMRPGKVLATLAGLAEFVGGLGLVIGLLIPFAAAAIVARGTPSSAAARESDFASTTRAKASSSAVSSGLLIWIIFGQILPLDRFLWQASPGDIL